MSEASGEPIPGELAARLREDPWARALGVEYLEIRRGYCRLALTLRPHMLEVVVTDEAGTRVAHVHGVAHRVQRRS